MLVIAFAILRGVTLQHCNAGRPRRAGTIHAPIMSAMQDFVVIAALDKLVGV